MRVKARYRSSEIYTDKQTDRHRLPDTERQINSNTKGRYIGQAHKQKRRNTEIQTLRQTKPHRSIETYNNRYQQR